MCFFLFIHILISLLAWGGNALKWDLGRKKHILNNKKPGETLNIAIILAGVFSHIFFFFFLFLFSGNKRGKKFKWEKIAQSWGLTYLIYIMSVC